MITLTKIQARLVMLMAQNLLTPMEQKPTREDVLRTIEDMGALQIDTISVVARSPYFSLWSRLGDYDPAWLDELLQERAVFEFWAHAACFLPMEDFPYHRRLGLTGMRSYYRPGWFEQNRADCERVLEHIRQFGEVKSSSFERKDGRRGAWWDWKIEKDALEYWFQQGEVMVARRDHFQRVYDLRERLLPAWSDDLAPSLEETLAFLCEKTLQALGVALPAWVADYFRLPKKQVVQTINDLKKTGKAIEIHIEGFDEPALAHPANLHWFDAAVAGELEATHTTFLTPFDALVWDRKRTKQLFDFDYTIEVYQPQHKRVYGYYTMPILHRGSLVGRLDAKAHRQEGMFEVRSIHLEPGIAVDEPLAADLAEAIQNCATWHKTPRVLLQKTSPTELLPVLSNYFMN